MRIPAMEQSSRLWHLLLFLVVTIALAAQAVLVLTDGTDANSGTHVTGDTVARLVRLFSYFTIDSNILVAVCCAALVLNAARDSRVWRVLRLDALLSIAVTGLVFALLLAPHIHLTGTALYLTVALHYIAPPAALVGWLLFGPRAQTDGRTLVTALRRTACWACPRRPPGSCGWRCSTARVRPARRCSTRTRS
ncbi:Pr6Pr family membrane protein [Streptomyces rochei]|uniref:Pr6Pr family membrane protein n=1 Tax=Streptomyces rochei TaxID=1928 RepID=UPI0033B48A54